jgi:hypothetical protein
MPNDLVPVRIGYAEKVLIESAMAAKDRWNLDVKLRFIPIWEDQGNSQ